MSLKQRRSRFCVAEGKKNTGRFHRLVALPLEQQWRVSCVSRIFSGHSNESAYKKVMASENINNALVCDTCTGRVADSITMEEDVVSLRSNISNGGFGLFATRQFLKGEYITSYGGEIFFDLSLSEAFDRNLKTSHFMHCARRRCINGDQNYKVCIPGKQNKGLAQFMNTTLRSDCNVQWKKNGGLVQCDAYATKDIQAGEELFAPYTIYVDGLNKRKRESVPQNLDAVYRNAKAKEKRPSKKPRKYGHEDD